MQQGQGSSWKHGTPPAARRPDECDPTTDTERGAAASKASREVGKGDDKVGSRGQSHRGDVATAAGMRERTTRPPTTVAAEAGLGEEEGPGWGDGRRPAGLART